MRQRLSRITTSLGGRLGRTAVIAGVATASIGLFATAASAHIAIGDGTAPAGAEVTVLHFHVPNESDTASTTKVEIAMPEGVNLPFVLARLTNNWKVTTEKRTLSTPVKTEGGDISEVVSKVTFEGGSIAPGQFETFDLEVGPLPDTPGVTLAFPAVQTYSDGKVSNWIDKVVEGQPEPESPTPLLTLTAADTKAAPAVTTDNDSHVLGIIALILGGLGALLGVGAFAAARRKP